MGLICPIFVSDIPVGDINAFSSLVFLHDFRVRNQVGYFVHENCQSDNFLFTFIHSDIFNAPANQPRYKHHDKSRRDLKAVQLYRSPADRLKEIVYREKDHKDFVALDTSPLNCAMARHSGSSGKTVRASQRS